MEEVKKYYTVFASSACLDPAAGEAKNKVLRSAVEVEVVGALKGFTGNKKTDRKKK